MCLLSYLTIGVCLALISCSDNKKNNSTEQDEVTTDSLMISVGGLSDYAKDELSEALKEIIRVYYDQYLLERKGNEVMLTVKIKGSEINKDSVELIKKLSNAKMEIALVDDHRTEIGNQRLELVDISLPELIEWALANRTYEYKEVTFKCNNFTQAEKVKNTSEVKIYAVRASAVVSDNVSDDVRSNSDDFSSSDEEDFNNSMDETQTSHLSSSSGSENWDSVLDSYERYVDKYIAIMKKAQSGDASAMSEYPSLMQEAQEYGDKLQNAKGSLSASQMARYQRITNKMLKAAQ